MITAVLTEATKTESVNYNGVYPLWGWVEVEGRKFAVEDLSNSWPETDPQFEIIMPDGFHSACDDLHTVLAFDLTDLEERAISFCKELVPCVECHL